MTDTPTTARCDTCEHPRPGRHTTRCPDHIRDLLTTIHELAPLLDIRPRQGASDVFRVPVFASRPPINLHVRAMLDPASSREVHGPDDEPRPPLPVWETLEHWRGKAADVGGNLNDTAWVIHQPWCPDMVVDLRTLAAQVGTVCGEPPPRPVGRCRQVRGITTAGLLICDEPLYMPRVADRGFDEPVSAADLPEVACPVCDKTYAGIELLGIRAAS